MQDFIFVQFFHMAACNACGKKYMTKWLLTNSVKYIIQESKSLDLCILFNNRGIFLIYFLKWENGEIIVHFFIYKL
jgi:hypothetical protein